MTLLLAGLESIEKAKEFRKDRLNKVNNGEVWGPLSDGPYCVVHWLPISEKALFKPDDIKSLEISKFIRMRTYSESKRLNLDGVRFYSNEKEITHPFIEGDKGRYFWNAQIFHSGALEMAFALSFRNDPPGRRWLYPGEFINDLWVVMDGFKKCMSHFDITAPIIIGVSLLRVLDYRFPINSRIRFFTGDYELHPPSDREQITLPEIKIENLQEVKNIEDFERPAFDILWQSFGLEKCDYYDEDGKRIP
ncbi:MAG: hypothetical protein OXF05_08230 [Hyphomicrobiales bacterium]|nr:hypothetical protein [Hyphomicrobiales bacterium]